MLHSDLLALLTAHELRFIATQLQLRHRQDNRADWLTAIHDYWHQPATRTHALAGLSLPACRALWRLLQVPSMPAHLLRGDFGPIQQTGRRQAVPTSKPAQIRLPGASPTQELYNIGLLYAADGKMLEQASDWTVPDDLRPPLRAWLERQRQRWQQQPLPPLAVSHLAPSAFALLHDLCQVLALARQHPQAIRHPNRFPALAHQQSLRQGLIAPVPAASPPSPSAAPLLLPAAAENEPRWLRFLGQLATAAGLLRNGAPQPLLWDWLRQPAAEQLRTLWQAWLDLDATVVGGLFQQPSLAGIAGWLAALAGLANQPDAEAADHFSAADLCHRLLALPADHPQPYRHWFTKLSEVDGQLAVLLQAYLLPWGVVEVAGQQAAPFLRPVDAETLLPLAPATGEVCYRISDLGRFLLLSQSSSTLASTLGWDWQRGAQQWLAVSFGEPTHLPARAARPTVVWTLIQHSQGDPEALLLLAPFCATRALEATHHVSAAPGDGQPALPRWQRRLTLTTHSLALAASQGYGMADLWHFVQQSGLTLRPGDWKLLQHALHEGNRVSLRPALLLQTDNAELMRQIQQTTTLRPFLDEMLTPTLATWQGDHDDWIARLQEAGFFAQALPSTAPMASLSASTSAPDNPAAPSASAAILAVPVAEAAVLWLALQVYERVGRYAQLPLRVAPETVRHLLATLSPTQQGSLNTQLRAIEASLASAIDQLPFIPPKEPSDPEAWRALLDQAIEHGHDLQLLHWSAGRGLAVQRRVTPCYVDEQRFGGPALRAVCHASGRDLWFRLDRIQAATLVVGEGE